MRSTRFWHLRRAVFIARRNVPRLARPLSRSLKAPPPRSPVFIIGCPRSGTTALRSILMASDEVAGVHAEGHILWDEFHGRRRRASDALGAGDVTEREREYIYLAIRLWTRGRRFLDKTPENCLRIEYLDALFPDAFFVFLHRRGADNVNSLMEGWRARPRFVTHRLPEPLQGIEPLDGSRWSFVLTPGWRELRHAPLATICAHQYVACNQAILAARATLDPARWLTVSYEELTEDPGARSRSICEAIGVVPTPAVEQAARQLPHTVTATAVTAPRQDKWREQNREAIEGILPLVEETERQLGYEPLRQRDDATERRFAPGGRATSPVPPRPRGA